VGGDDTKSTGRVVVVFPFGHRFEPQKVARLKNEKRRLVAMVDATGVTIRLTRSVEEPLWWMSTGRSSGSRNACPHPVPVASSAIDREA
jgi:hypothetical protein